MSNAVKVTTRYYSTRQEKSIEKSTGAKRTPNSGAGQWVKGDLLSKHVLIEAKTTMSEKQSFSIQKKWLEKMKEEAFAMGKSYSALAFNYGDGVNYYVINEKLFKLLLEVLDKEDDLK